MIFDTLRVFADGMFHETELPDWYHEAARLSEKERIDWHCALEHVLDCEHTLLTEGGTPGGWIEVRFWPSPTQGIFVLLETPLGFVEQVFVPDPTDWLPFLSTYLAQFITASAQSAMVEVHGKIANTLIANARHGEGSHVDRQTGLSRIDLDNDRNHRRAEQVRQAMAKAGKDVGA